MLEKLDRLLVILLGDLRWKVVMETLGISFDLDVNSHLTLFVDRANGANLPFGGEIGPVQVERVCL